MYSGNTSLTNLKPTCIDIKSNRWVCKETQFNGIYLKITLIGNKLNTTFHEMHEFWNCWHSRKNIKIIIQTKDILE